MPRPQPGQEVFLGPGPSSLTTQPPTNTPYGGRAVCDPSDPPFHRSPAGSKETQLIPPGAPTPVLHLPRDTSQTDSSLCPFWAAPFSAATVGGGPGLPETEAAEGRVGLPPGSLSPPLSVPPSHLQEPLLASQSPQCLPAALALVITRDSLYRGLLSLMWDLPNINVQPKGVGF